MAICRGCGRMSPLPIDRLVQRFGDLFPVEIALTFVMCAGCGRT